MFGSDSFPVGPNNRFPRQRVSTYGNQLIPPVSMQDTYLSGNNTVAKLPSTEKNYHTSVNKVKGRMKEGDVVRTRYRHMDIDRFRPRYAPPSSLRHALGQDEDLDEDSVYIERAGDEGETDDSVGQWGGIRAAMESARARAMAERKVVPVMGSGHHNIRTAVEKIGTKAIHPATGIPKVARQEPGWGWGWGRRTPTGWGEMPEHDRERMLAIKREMEEERQRKLEEERQRKLKMELYHPVVGSGGWLKGIQALFAGTPKVTPTNTNIMRATATRMSVGLFGDSGMGALPRTTSSGRTIATTWRYGKGTYYRTVRDSKGIVERGQFIGKGTSPIDYV